MTWRALPSVVTLELTPLVNVRLIWPSIADPPPPPVIVTSVELFVGLSVTVAPEMKSGCAVARTCSRSAGQS